MGIFRNMALYPKANKSYWMASTDLKVNNNFGSSTLKGNTKVINDKLYMYGYDSGSTNRPYYVNYDDSNGSLSSYKVFPDASGTFGTRYEIRDVVVDSSGNTHVVWNGSILIKYDSSGAYVTGKQLSGTTDLIGEADSMVIDSADNIYLLTLGTTYVIVTKIVASTYSITWSNKINFGFGGTTASYNILLDPSENLYVVAENTGSVNACIFKMDTSGTTLWQKSSNLLLGPISNTICFDNSDNVYFTSYQNISGTNYQKLFKLDSSGVKQYEFNVDTSSSYIRDLTINTSGELVFMYADTGGMYVSRFTTAPAPLNTIYITVPSFGSSNALLCKSSTGVYLNFSMTSSGKSIETNLKLPSDITITTSTPYNFTVTSDNGSNFVFSGTLAISSTSTPSMTSSSNISFNDTFFGVSSETITTSSITQNLGSTVPFNNATALV
jgi:hypothetical protein